MGVNIAGVALDQGKVEKTLQVANYALILICNPIVKGTVYQYFLKHYLNYNLLRCCDEPHICIVLVHIQLQIH